MTYGRSKTAGNKNWRVCLWLTACVFTVFMYSNAFAAPNQKVFTSADAAVRSLIDALRKDDTGELIAIFGPSGRDLVNSGDPAQDKEDRASFLQAYDGKNRLEEVGRKKVILHVGNDDWPMPIPIIKAGRTWRFDTKEGRSEILARRIGRNELSVIQVCLAYVDAQREYALRGKSSGVAEYARQFLGEPGKENGLCQADGQDAPLSPMGPLIAGACPENFSPEDSGKAFPYHGYFYKILAAQGQNAPGGAYDYLVKGKMIGGFGLVAYPARYRSTGVMTFIVNHDGTVYEKDLGKNTSSIAEKMLTFDPDRTWRRVE